MATKIAIIGAGWMAAYHVAGFRAGGAEVVAIVDKNAAAATAAAQKYGVEKTFGDAKELYAAIKDLDAVAIAGVMIGAWVLVALIEWAASRAEREQPIPVYAAGPPESARADPAWFAPPVEHTLLDASGDDPVTAVTRLPPVSPEDDPEATVEQRPAV